MIKLPKTSEIPIRVPFEEYWQYLKNPEKLRNWAYGQSLVANEFTHEPLVNLTDLGISNYSYECEHNSHEDALRLLGHDVVLKKDVCVRKTVGGLLRSIDGGLKKEGFHLHVRSGYRSPELQELAFLKTREKKGEDFAKSRYAIKSDLVGKEAIFPHATGGTVDVELYCGESLVKMKEEGVPVGVWDLEILFSEDPQAKKFKKPKEVPENWKNYLLARRVLYHAMVNQDDLREKFIPIIGEYWHFSRGDFLSGVVAKLLGFADYKPYYGLAK